MNFRKATINDADLLYTWINQPSVREQSFSEKEILYADHLSWLLKKLNDATCFLYIAYSGDKQVGMIRFDNDHDTYIISYLINEAQQGKGYGNAIIEKGTIRFLEDSSFKGYIYASVKKSNTASIKIFLNSHFQQEEIADGVIRFRKLFYD